MSDLYKLKKAPAGSSKKWQVRVRTPSGGVKTVQFGARGYEDYTQHKDKSRRDNYRSRHRHDKINDPTKAGFWSWHVLWGDSTDIKRNLAAVKRKYRLNPSLPKSFKVSVSEVSEEELDAIKQDYYAREHYDAEANPAEFYMEPDDTFFEFTDAGVHIPTEDDFDEPTLVDFFEKTDVDYRWNPAWANKLGRGTRRAGIYAKESYRDFLTGYKEARENPPRRFPRSTVVQTLIFDKDAFSKSQARRWAKQHDFLSTGVDETENTYRIRQYDPSEFVRGTFRTIEMTDGVQAVVAMPKTGFEK